jgi:putative oxidoreductase
MRIIHGLGRAIFGGFFLYNGINHLRNTEALGGYAAAKQVDYPHLSVQASGILMTAAGAALVLGFAPRLGALGVAGFLAAASPKMHDFWNMEDPGHRQGEMIHFSKNMALLGAAIALAGLATREREDLES